MQCTLLLTRAVLIGILPGFGIIRLIIGAIAGFFIGMLIEKKVINKQG
ncbi:hypothetical protein [Treponema sp. R6D11]